MNDRIDPADAAHALGEIGLRREQVIRRPVIPAWNWWSHGVLIIVLTAAIESRRGVLVAIGIAVFVAVSLVIDIPVSRAARAAPVHRSLFGPGARRGTLVGLVAFVVVLLGV